MTIGDAFSLTFDHTADALRYAAAIHLSNDGVSPPAMEIKPPR
jgi:hypothetical protein